MVNDTRRAPATAIGIDLGDKSCAVCVVDERGTVVEEARIPTTRSAFLKRFRGQPPSRIAIETGTHSPWIDRLLKDCGHEVVVANSRKLRLVYENESKNDRVDAEYLARLARVDPKLLSPVVHRSETAQRDRAILQARSALVKARTDLINHVRGAVKSIGGRLPMSSTDSFAGNIAPHIPRELWPALSPLVDSIAAITRKILDFEKLAEKIAKERYPATELLRQVPGVGVITALAYVLAIQDPHRFKQSRAIGSYLGLRPRQCESGESQPQLRITKAGDSDVRRLLVQAAHYILGVFGPDSDLRRWGLALAQRGGKTAKKRAVVAVARKLAVLLHRLWITGAAYEPLRHTKVA